MRKVIPCIVALLMQASLCVGQNQPLEPERYSITALGVYDHSRTFAHQGGLDLAAHATLSPYVEADAACEFIGPKILAGTIIARPKLPLRVGELFLDGSLHLRSFHTFGIGTCSVAASLGYRTDHVSLQLGAQRTLIRDLSEEPDVTHTNILEPLNPLFRFAFQVRPATSPWNVSLGIGNFTLYQYERFYFPLLFLGGHYSLTDHLAAQAEADLKPSGMFNYNAHFNELSVRAGLTYTFR